MKTLNVGVIGLGNMGKNHVRNYHEIPYTTITGLCDIQIDIAREFAKKYKCNSYSDLDTFLAAEQLDAVSITAPTYSHYEIAKKVIAKGIHVLIEKPISYSLETAQALIDLAEEKGVILMVGHIERFNPAVKKLKELVDEDGIGEITSLIAKRVGAFPAQIKDANVVIDLAVHDIDIFSYILGKSPTGVYGNAGKALASNREDYAEIFLTYGNQNGFIQVNWITPIRIRNLAVTGTKGYIELNYMTQELVVHQSNYWEDFDTFGDYIIRFGNPSKKEIQINKQEPLRLEIEHFADCIFHNKPPLISGKIGKEALKTALDVMTHMNMDTTIKKC